MAGWSRGDGCEALKREVLHRLGAKSRCGKLISFVSHPYEHYDGRAFLYECHLMAASSRLAM